MCLSCGPSVQDGGLGAGATTRRPPDPQGRAPLPRAASPRRPAAITIRRTRQNSKREAAPAPNLPLAALRAWRSECRPLAELRHAPSMGQTLRNPRLGDERHRCGHHPSATRPVSAVRGEAKGWRPSSNVWAPVPNPRLKDMQRSVRTRESAQDLSWLCSLPCGNSGRRRPAAVSVAFLGALPGDTSVRRAPCARVEPGAYLIGEPERRGSDGPWGERARSGSLTDRLRRATVEVPAGLLPAHGKVLTPPFPDFLRR